MPSRAVPRRVEDFILYYYAKLVVAVSAGERANYRFIMDRYKRLKTGEIRMSDYDREIQRLAQQAGTCVFCNSPKGSVPKEVIPRRLGGPVGMQNQVYTCPQCAASKADQDLLYWWCEVLGKHKDELPRIPAGLFLKMAYERHTIAFTLGRTCHNIRDIWK